MNELRERIREIAIDVVRRVNGEVIDNPAAGVVFQLPMVINQRNVNVRFRCILSDLLIESVGVYENNDIELTEYENQELVRQQERRLNSLFGNVLRLAGFRDRRRLRRNLRGV